MSDNYNHIIYFDGVCSLCQAWVRFVTKRDKDKIFHFSSLQSDYAQSKIKANDKLREIDSIIYYVDGKYHIKSSAALHILKDIGGFWKLAFLFIIVPPFIRNFVYDFIARKRYSWFGKSDKVCELLGSADIERMIE